MPTDYTGQPYPRIIGSERVFMTMGLVGSVEQASEIVQMFRALIVNSVASYLHQVQ